MLKFDNVQSDFIKLMKEANAAIADNDFEQVVILKSKSDKIYFFKNNLKEYEADEFIEALSKEEDTCIELLVCMWNNNNGVDVPAYYFREKLREMNDENNNTKIILQGFDGYYHEKALSTTMK